MPESKSSAADRSLSRKLPLRVKLELRFMGLLFFIGLLFSLIGVPAAIFFIANSDLRSLVVERNNYKTTQGILSSVGVTEFSENKEPILEYGYRFGVAGKVFKNVSYSEPAAGYKKGDTIPVRYEANDPENSVIEGMRFAPFGSDVWIALLFPLAGLSVLSYALRKGNREIRLITHGVLTTGKVISKRRTWLTVNKRRVYEVQFGFKDTSGQTVTATLRTAMPERVGDEENEPLLYLPDKPQEVLLPDLLPASVRRYIASGF